MTFKTAQESFESALKIAESGGDSAMEHLSTGLIDLTRAIKADLARIKTELVSLKSKVNSLR
jgi:hypothetical protein